MLLTHTFLGPFPEVQPCERRTTGLLQTIGVTGFGTHPNLQTGTGALTGRRVADRNQPYGVLWRCTSTPPLRVLTFPPTSPGPPLSFAAPHRGMYRASGAKWHHPKEAVPPNSTLDAAEGAMRTAMSWVAPGSGAAGATGAGSGLRGGYWTVRFEVPLKLAPLHLAFALYHPGAWAGRAPRRRCGRGDWDAL